MKREVRRVPKIIMEKPWDIQRAADVLYRLYAEQYGVKIKAIVTPKTKEELAAYGIPPTKT